MSAKSQTPSVFPEGSDAKVHAEREQTDEGLRTERRNTDEVIAESRVKVEADTDKAVERAREQSDELLTQSRDQADETATHDDSAAGNATDDPTIAETRALQDDVLREQRDSADESLRRQREEQVTHLASLLPLEREKTDRYLLTERARADAVLAHRDDFLGMVSHDLRNLLTGIYLNASIVSSQASDSEEGRRTVDGIKGVNRYIARMNRLIGDLIDVVSLDAGVLRVQQSRSDAVALMAEAVQLFTLAAAEKGVTLGLSVVDGVAMVRVDRERILQVLANLVTNAIKFTPRGGEITLQGCVAGDTFQFSVVDTGSGIAPHMLEAVFERFWQVGKNDRRGVGLGLYISKGIVDAHGGKMWAESTPGVGSTFHFTIPAKQPVASM